MKEKGVYANGAVDISLDMLSCRAIGGDIIQKKDIDILRELITLERDEREKNPGVWDFVPETVPFVRVSFMYDIPNCVPGTMVATKEFTRTLPKTKAREIAEKWADKFSNIGKAAEIIESAINEAMEGEK